MELEIKMEKRKIMVLILLIAVISFSHLVYSINETANKTEGNSISISFTDAMNEGNNESFAMPDFQTIVNEPNANKTQPNSENVLPEIIVPPTQNNIVETNQNNINSNINRLPKNSQVVTETTPNDSIDKTTQTKSEAVVQKKGFPSTGFVDKKELNELKDKIKEQTEELNKKNSTLNYFISSIAVAMIFFFVFLIWFIQKKVEE